MMMFVVESGRDGVSDAGVDHHNVSAERGVGGGHVRAPADDLRAGPGCRDRSARRPHASRGLRRRLEEEEDQETAEEISGGRIEKERRRGRRRGRLDDGRRCSGGAATCSRNQPQDDRDYHQQQQ